VATLHVAWWGESDSRAGRAATLPARTRLVGTGDPIVMRSWTAIPGGDEGVVEGDHADGSTSSRWRCRSTRSRYGDKPCWRSRFASSRWNLRVRACWSVSTVRAWSKCRGQWIADINCGRAYSSGTRKQPPSNHRRNLNTTVVREWQSRPVDVRM